MSKNENGTNVKRELELSEEFAGAAGGYWFTKSYSYWSHENFKISCLCSQQQSP